MACTADEIVNLDCPAGGADGLMEFIGLSGAGLATSVVILAALYTWATLFRSTQLHGYVKAELYEVFVSALLVLFLVAFIASMDQIRIGTVLPEDMIPKDDQVDEDTTIYAATARYYERVGEDMAKWLNMNYWISMYVDQIASVTPYARPLGVGLVASPMAGLASPIKQLLYNMSVALSVAFIMNSAQRFVFLFALQGFIKYYLPIGIFLRTFTPTRRLGGALIGLALTFLLVFPALTVVSFSMFYRDEGPLITFGEIATHYFEDTTGNFWQSFSTFYGNKFSDVGQSVSGLVGGAFGSIGQLFQKLIGTIFLSVMLFPISVVSYAFAIGFVIPAFNILILSAAAKSLSQSFGEEIDIGSLTRLI